MTEQEAKLSLADFGLPELLIGKVADIVVRMPGGRRDFELKVIDYVISGKNIRLMLSMLPTIYCL